MMATKWTKAQHPPSDNTRDKMRHQGRGRFAIEWKTMAAHALALLALATMTTASPPRSGLKWCRRRPYTPWMDADQSIRGYPTPGITLKMRGGGGGWGLPRRGREGDKPEEDTAAPSSDEEEGEYEYEYEYEYCEVEGDEEQYENDDSQDDDVEDEYYGEELGSEPALDTRGEDEEEEGGTDAEIDEDDYLFTTPIPSAKGSDTQSPPKLELVNRTSPKADFGMEGYDGDDDYDDAEDYAEEGMEYEDPDDYLLETPISSEDNVKPQHKATAIKRKAPKASKHTKSPWWQYGDQSKDSGQSKRKQWRPVSATKATFVSPLFYSGGSSRSFSLRSSTGRPIYYGWISSISSAIRAVAQPIGSAVQTITFVVGSTVSRWISFTFYAIRNSFDFIWYGPVDGVTTTGLTTREGGLSALLMSTPVTIAISSIVVLGLMTVMVRRIWHGAPGSNVRMNRLFRNRGINGSGGFEEAAEISDEDDMAPPSVEDELQFLNREFDAANPSSTDRITKAITKENRLSSLLHRGDRPKSRRGQREFTIKSIKTWWKERPSQQSIAIIEPQHLRNERKPLNQEIKRLQKQLSVSEQERAILQQDVQRLQHRLQKAQEDARSIKSQNNWLEKQTSKADQILSKAVEVERKKANEEMGRVRESMKGVLERERMLMRGRIGSETEGKNDLDLNRGPPTRRLDGVRIVRDVDDEVDDPDDGDESWTAL